MKTILFWGFWSLSVNSLCFDGLCCGNAVLLDFDKFKKKMGLNQKRENFMTIAVKCKKLIKKIEKCLKESFFVCLRFELKSQRFFSHYKFIFNIFGLIS
jgi:hypothetical protein